MNDIKVYSDPSLKAKIGYLLDQLNTCTLIDLNNCLYFLDEESVKNSGIPFTWQNYKIWEIGPICQNLYLEFIESIRFKSKGVSLGLSDFISCPGGRWTNTVTVTDSYDIDELSENDIELINRMVHIFNDNIANNTWLFALVGTLYHKYTNTTDIQEQWELMDGQSYTLLNWIEYLDTPFKKLLFKTSSEAIKF